MLLFPLVIYITLFFHKICRKESTDEDAGLTLTDLLERYMFPQSQLMLCSKIGKGNFGPVYKGYAHKIQPHENETLVAIKTVKGSENSTSLAETQKVNFETYLTKVRTSIVEALSLFIFLDVTIFGIRIEDFDDMRRTFEFGQSAWNCRRKYCKP